MTTVSEPVADAGNTVAVHTTFRRCASRAAVVSRPVLWERLGEAARVTAVSAPPGSGKTVLLRSWISAAGLAEYAAWVPVGRDEGDPQRLWLAMLDALRQTAPGSGLVRPLTAAPDLDGWAIMERLLTDLAPLRDQLWLVMDDLHELDSDQARRQLELLVMRAPAELRFVMATRHDVRLGLHRLRLEGELTEIRADDLRFTVAEARALFQAAGVELPEPTLALLMDRTEGWAAGLRLAALSLAGHPDPERFAEEFRGSERTVAEYLLAEVLDRQPEQVRRLLLRTSVLERVNGELADLLTGSSGGERVLQDLEEANAFVVSLDVARSWFRYHHLFADLLQLELRRTEPGEVAALHELAADWFADHGFPVEAVRHAQAAQDWDRAARLLADHWAALKLGGRTATVHALLAGFPAAASFADAELAAVAAADELAQGSLLAAERYLDVAERGQASVPLSRRWQAQVLLGVVRLLLYGRSGDQWARAEQAQRLLTAAEAPEAAQPMKEASDGGTGRLAWGGEELRTLALLEIGNAQTWTGRFEAAECHLDQAVALARRIRWPYLEFMGLVYRAEMELSRRLPRAAELSRQAIDLAERHGWTADLFAGFAAITLGSALSWQGRLDEADTWVQRAERTFRAEADPASALGGHYVRGQLELGRGRAAGALSAFRAAEHLAGPNPLARPLRAWIMLALVRLGDTERAERALADLSERDRDRREMRIAAAALRLAQHDPAAATAALAPVLDGSTQGGWRSWLAEAFPSGGDRPGRARRSGRRRARPGARARSRRTRRGALVVPAAPRTGPARAAGPAAHRACGTHCRDSRPAGREPARAAARRAAATARPAQQERDPRAALPAHPPVSAGDRQRAVRIDEHRQDPPAQPVRQTRRAQPGRSGRVRPRPGPARTLRTAALTQAWPAPSSQESAESRT